MISRKPYWWGALSAVFFLARTICCEAGGGPKNVLLVINDNSPVSQSIGTYYQQKRGIPDRNVCHIACSTSEVTGKSDYFNNIAQPIRNFIESRGIRDRIDYIVLTKGIPLTVSWTQFPDTYIYSVTSMLTCVGEPTITDAIINPYGPKATPSAPTVSFSHNLDFNGKHFYAVTRLDARTEADIRRMIDDSIAAKPSPGLFLLDGASVPGYDFTAANNRLRSANSMLLSRGFTTYYDDVTFDTRLTEFVGRQQDVMGYFSWGSNESSFTHDLYVSNRFIPGSIADTFVSTSGRTFTSPWQPGTQSLVVDLIESGASAVNGYVAEPAIGCATYPNVLFDRYTKGYNVAESFLAATPYLYWRSVVSGDPLMAPYATPPSVSIISPDPSRIARGRVPIKVSASDPSGVSKVELYIDDRLVATLPSPPYEYEWDTTTCLDGTHLVEAIAYENSDVQTQGMARITVKVANSIVNVQKLSELEGIGDGQIVSITSKPVIAGTDAFTDGIYICELDRSTGIRVIGANNVPTGTQATVIGEILTCDAQKMIRAESVTVTGVACLPEPIAVCNINVGNRGAMTDLMAKDLNPGLCNSGLLITTWGFVTKLVEDGFFISDQSLPKTSEGLKISLRNVATPIEQPLVGSHVVVTGVATFYNQDGKLKPTIRPRSQSDIMIDVPVEIFSSPSGVVRPGWNLVSLPAVALTPAPDQALIGFPVTGRLFVWDELLASYLTFDEYSADRFPALRPGLGFWIHAPQEYTIFFEGLLNAPQADFWISLPRAAFTLIGHPFNHPIDTKDCYISDGREMIPISKAADSGWVASALYAWDNYHLTPVAIDVGLESSAQLEPWKGYWIKTYRPNLALLIPYKDR